MSSYETALVLDSSRQAGERLAEMLAALRVRTRCVTSVDAARSSLREAPVSLLVFDTALEGAFEWLAECAHQSAHPALLVVTHLPHFEEEVRATLLGAIGYLARPVSAAALARSLCRTASPIASIPREDSSARNGLLA